MDTLRAMFVGVDDDVLLTVLESNNMNVEAAVEELLMLDSGPPMGVPVARVSESPMREDSHSSGGDSPFHAGAPRAAIVGSYPAPPVRLAPSSSAALSRPENLFDDHDAEIDAQFYKDDEPVATTGDPLMDDEMFARRLQEEMNREQEEQRTRDAEIARTLHQREVARRHMVEGASSARGGGAAPSLVEMHQMLISNPEIVNRFKTAFIPIIREKIQGIKLPINEGQFDSPVGLVWFSVDNVAVARVEILPENVDIVLGDNISISVRDLAIQMTEAQWKYRKLSFPHFASSGTAVCGVSGCALELRMKLDMGAGELGLRTIAPTTVRIEKLDIKVRGSMVRWLYNMILGIFKTTLRTNIERSIADMVDDMVNNQSGDLLQGMMSAI